MQITERRMAAVHYKLFAVECCHNLSVQLGLEKIPALVTDSVAFLSSIGESAFWLTTDKESRNRIY